MSTKENAKGCSTIIIILFGIGFIGMAAETLLGFYSEENPLSLIF